MPKLPAIVPRAIRIALALLVLAVGAIALGGCGGSDAEPQAPVASTTHTSLPMPGSTTTPATTATPTRTATLYFADADAAQLIEESRPTSATGSDLRVALVELAKGPASASTQQRALPKGTAVIGTNVRGGEALVNVSGEFIQGYPSGGAAAEFAVLAPLVYTATAIDGVERLRITVDGKTPAPVGSQFDWARAFTRADFPDVLAAP